MNTNLPKRISQKWLQQKKTSLGYTRKVTEDGEVNPSYTELETEVREAEQELERWNNFESWVKTKLDMILNIYPLRTGKQTYEPSQVFLKKCKTTGQTTFMTRQQAWEEYLKEMAK